MAYNITLRIKLLIINILMCDVSLFLTSPLRHKQALNACFATGKALSYALVPSCFHTGNYQLPKRKLLVTQRKTCSSPLGDY